QVQPDHGNIQRPRSLNSGFNQHGVQLLGDVFQGAAGVQVGGAAHGQMLAAGQDAVVVEAGFLQTAQGFVVHGDAAFTTGGRLAPATLGFDQLAYAVGTVTDRKSTRLNSSHVKIS